MFVGDWLAADLPLLPCHLPPRPGALFSRCSGGGFGRRRARRLTTRRNSWLLAEWQTVMFTYLSLDCPVSVRHVARKLGPYGVSDVQAQAFNFLVEANLVFGRLSGRSLPPGEPRPANLL